MTDPKAPPPGDTKVPRIVRDAGEAVARDIKPALRLMGRIFFNTWLGDQSFVYDVAKDVARKSRSARSATGGSGSGGERTTAGPEHAAPAPAPAPAGKSGPVIIDAEFIEVGKDCPTCGGTRRVGRFGHEVTCPSCK